MAVKSSPSARKAPASQASQAPSAPGVTVTAPVATAPHGATNITVVGTPAGQVAHLAYLSTLAVPVTITAPLAPWAGWGKGVRVAGKGWTGTAYANRGNVDIRCTVAVAAAIAKATPGATVRGAASNYVRIPFTVTGTPQA